MKHATRYVQVLFADRITWGCNKTKLYANMTIQDEKLAQWSDMCEEQAIGAQADKAKDRVEEILDDILFDFIKSLDDTCKWSLHSMLEEHLFSAKEDFIPASPVQSNLTFDLAKYRFMR